MQAQRKQYGLKHYVAGTIHSVMGDTLMCIAIAKNLSGFRLWNKGQLIVILSRTKKGKDTIFIGDKDMHLLLYYTVSLD